MDPRASALTPEQFLERYGRYFNRKRIEAIRNLEFLFTEGSAEGAYFCDAEGRRFLDMWCMGGTFSLGHRHPAVLAAAERAMREEEFGSLFFFSEAKGKLAEKLAQCTPGRLETTHPVVTGGEAIDLSIKLARGSTGRSEILYADQGYHGCTGFALSMMAKGEMRDYAEPLVPDFHEIRFGDAADLAAKISERTAAVVLEPIRTDADMAIAPTGYFAEVRRLCDRTGAKLIIDEVVCGMGRLGHLWGCQYWDVEPDMLVTAKGFSGGLYPMSAVVTRPECLDFFGESPFRTISSFAWSNIGARISYAALVETERLLPRLATIGDRLEACLKTLQARYSSVLLRVRRAGMMFGLDFADAATGMGFLDAMFRLGVLVVASSQRWDIIKLYPPLILEQEHIATFAEHTESVLRQLS
ncbi:MAG: aspartate aminotransferase family protein [Deltaproteobacteria bacterium]|nr:aspartate aminotransferase family protein [Deltaproteobacteria bacterium]